MRKILFVFFTAISIHPISSLELHLQDALQRGLAYSLGLEKAALEINIADTNAYQAYLLPNPQFSINAETSSFMSSQNYDDSTFAYGLSQMLETKQKRRARREIAAAQQAAAEINFSQQKAATLLSIKEAYIEAAVAEEQLAIALENKILQEKILQTFANRADHGKLSLAEKIKAESCFQLFDMEYLQIENSYKNARLELAFKIGLEEGEFDLCFDVYEDIVAPNFGCHETENNLLKIKNLEIEAARQQVALEEAKRISDVAVTAGVFHEDNNLQPSGLFFGLSFALPIHDKNVAAVAKAQMVAEKHEIEKNEYLRQLKLGIRKKELALNQAYQEILCYKNCILAKSDEAYKNIVECYQAGKIEIDETFKAKKICLEYQEKYLDVFLRYHTLLIEYQKLTGVLREC